MKPLVVVVLLFAFFGSSFGATGYAFYKHPDHPGKCVYKNVVLSPGESRRFSFTEGSCRRIFCTGEDGRGKFHTCGVQGVSPPCILGDLINPDGAYPECCKKHFICPENFNKCKNKLLRT